MGTRGIADRAIGVDGLYFDIAIHLSKEIFINNLTLPLPKVDVGINMPTRQRVFYDNARRRNVFVCGAAGF